MAMTVSMARSLGLSRLAVPTQGNAGDSLAEYAVAAGIEAVIVMSPDTDLPVLGKVAAYAQLYPEIRQARDRPRNDHRLRQAGARGVRAPGLFQRRDFPGARLAHRGKEDAGPRDGRADPAIGLATGRWQLPDVIVYPTGGGTGVVGMAKAFDELEALGLVGPSGRG